MRAAPALLLVACGSPISNQTFYDDARMVAALPGSERLGAPMAVLEAPVGDSVVLAQAVQQAATLRDLVEVMVRSGDALRAADPSTRTDVARGWDAVQAAGDLEGRRAWWVRAEVLQPDDTAVVSWTLDLAPGPEGPWSAVAEGAHEPDGDGALIWQLGPTLEVLGLDPADAPGELQLTYGTEGDARTVELLYVDGEATLGPWGWLGDQVMAWQGPLALDDAPDAPTRYGAAQVFVGADGGWGHGTVYPDAQGQPFSTCWSALGDALYADGALPPAGTAAACPFPDPF